MPDNFSVCKVMHYKRNERDIGGRKSVILSLIMRRFIKNWALPISILFGAMGYLLFAALPFPIVVRHMAANAITVIQPLLIFTMLFITFCKLDVRDIRLQHWHVYGLLFQIVLFLLTAWFSSLMPDGWDVVIEGRMLCFVCPTATAAAVVTGKLGGNAGRVTAYPIMINLSTAFVFSVVIPLLHATADASFISTFFLICSKLFPLLILPIEAAMVARHYLHGLTRWFSAHPDLAFNMWIVALSLAIAITTRSIMHSHYPIMAQVGIALASAIACISQFFVGRWMGARESDAVTAGQALGQKNTIVAIWLGYTFLDPITSIAGGFYSIWHNVFNSWQLYQKRKQDERR